jgi:hypothetical protein
VPFLLLILFNGGPILAKLLFHLLESILKGLVFSECGEPGPECDDKHAKS